MEVVFSLIVWELEEEILSLWVEEFPAGAVAPFEMPLLTSEGLVSVLSPTAGTE